MGGQRKWRCLHFNPRSPHGERQAVVAAPDTKAYFNPRSPHGERHEAADRGSRAHISIHAPRTGSDHQSRCPEGVGKMISIHAPRTGSDPQNRQLEGCSQYFNPRSPHGERRRLREKTIAVFGISIHAPRTGSDTPAAGAPPEPMISIHAPRTGSDPRTGRRRRGRDISIHAPRTGSDRSIREYSRALDPHFNPRSPHGERPAGFTRRLP